MFCNVLFCSGPFCITMQLNLLLVYFYQCRLQPVNEMFAIRQCSGTKEGKKYNLFLHDTSEDPHATCSACRGQHYLHPNTCAKCEKEA